jgi:hypothetical protein
MAIHSDERYLRLKWCVHRSVYDEEIKSGPTGLILASTDSVMFTRIGMFEFMSTIEDEDLNKELGMSPLSQEHIDEQQTAQMNASRDINPRTFWLIWISPEIGVPFATYITEERVGQVTLIISEAKILFGVVRKVVCIREALVAFKGL